MAVILVAEDDVQFRSMLLVALHSAGHSIILASDGREAIRMARECTDRSPSLFIITQEIAGMKHADLVRELRDHESTKSTPILLLTKSPESAQEAPELEGAVCLRKPATSAEELQDIVRKLLRSILPPAQPLPAPTPLFITRDS